VTERPLFEWEWVVEHLDVLAARLGEHVWLTVLAVSIGVALSIPLGVAAHRVRWLRPAITGATGVIYTIPSLALFAMLLPFTGLSTLTAEIGLVGYTLFILVRNVVAGLEGVSADVKEAARGMGHTPWQLFRRVELPLALPAIMAGIRIATVTTVGLVTVTILIGKGGLGHVFFQLGFRRLDSTPMLVGSVLAIALALAAEAVLVWVERRATPWAGRRRTLRV
jgi:osmoprotectant transport system permease protein